MGVVMNINRCMMEVDVRENWGRDRGRSGDRDECK